MGLMTQRIQNLLMACLVIFLVFIGLFEQATTRTESHDEQTGVAVVWFPAVWAPAGNTVKRYITF